MRFRGLCASLLAAAAVAAGCGSGAPGAKPVPGNPAPAVVVDSPSAAKWVRLLRVSGRAARTGPLADLLARRDGVVPGQPVLSGGDRRRLVRWVEDGGRLATTQRQLLGALGVRHRPQIASVRRGKGRVVVFPVDPLGGGRDGWERLPQAGLETGRLLGAPLGPRARSAEIFVDPGGLANGLERSPERIAALLDEAGARVAEIAGWNDDFTNPADDYDYASLIRALHARGILAYAWLEPPFVTLRLWQQHPECREKTQSGRDAHVDWRSLIALEDDRCLALAEDAWRHVLTSFPWDGVNVAELYFEPPTAGPDGYTPFGAAALARFGGDPAADPAGFAAFRTRLATELNGKVLDFLHGLPQAQHWQLELSAIDDTLDPALAEGIGVDDEALAAVARRDGAELVVEDPHTQWATGPFRYDALGRHVRSLMPPGDALLDVNVVPRPNGVPTSQMTGAELAIALSTAASRLGRVAIYALGTLTRADLAAIPGALAGSDATTDIGVFGSWTVEVRAPSPAYGRLTVDGIPWPAARGRALVPAGNHLLHWSRGAPRVAGLLSLTGQLGSARLLRDAFRFSYDSHPDALVVVTRRPTGLRLDGARAPLDVTAGPGGRFVVRLPPGTHRVVLGF